MRSKGRHALRPWLKAVLQPRIVLLAVVVAVYLMGMIAGFVAVGTLDATGSNELSTFLRDSMHQLGREGAGAAGWRNLLIDEVLQPAGLIWLLGMSVVGAPLIAAVVFLRGYVLGFTLLFLLKAMMLKGALLAFLTLLPQHLLMIPGLILAAAGAAAFSLGALQIVMGRPGIPDIYQHLRMEGSLALAGCALLFAGGVFKVYITPVVTVAFSRLLL